MSSSRWRTLTLGDVTSEGTERLGSPTSSYVVYGVDSSVGLTPTPKYVSGDLSRYKRLLPGMFAYNPMRLNIGSIGYCSGQHEPGLVSPDYVVFRCDRTSLEPDFLKYYIQSAAWREWTKRSGVGSVRVRIYYGELARMPITLPPLPEQRAIAQILSTLDDKMQRNGRVNETLEAIARAIFKSWFVDFDPVRAKRRGVSSYAPAISPDIADLFPDSFEDSELGEIPKGWRVNGLTTIARMEKRSVLPGKEPKRLWEHYSIPAFDDGRTPTFELGHRIKSGKYTVPSSCVLVSKLNPQFPRVWLPDIQGEDVAICSTEFLPFVPGQPHWRPFLYELMRSDTVQQGIQERVTGTTGSRQRAKPDDVAVMQIVHPGDALLEQFGAMVGPLHEKLLASIQESRTLAALRDTLLPRLISGELRVKNAKRFTGR